LRISTGRAKITAVNSQLSLQTVPVLMHLGRITPTSGRRFEYLSSNVLSGLPRLGCVQYLAKHTTHFRCMNSGARPV
jgi:hypothetical protein